jgi:PAS domain S-box-containing protein
MEEALRVSENRFRGIVEAAAEGIWIVDGESRTTFANARMGELLGYTPEELLGRSCFDFIHPDDADPGRAGFHRRKHHADVSQREYRFIRRDGTVIWLSFIGSPLAGADGAMAGVIAMVTDITERRRAEERIVQLNRQLAAKVSELETLLSVVPVGIAFSSSASSATARLNVAAQRILGIEGRDSLLNAPADSGSFPFHLLDGDRKVPDEELPMQVAARTGQSVPDAEYELVRVDGQIIPILCSASPLLTGDGHPRGSVFAMIDISERKAMETALRRANAALEQFAYAAAHDLQEPVRNVAIYTQLLSRSYRGKFDAEADVFLEFIVTGARRIQNLIADLLSYTRATDDFEVANASTDATAAINEVVQNLRVAIADSHATIRFSNLPSVRIRKGHLVQILQNLVSNAIKYRGAEDPLIRVTAQKIGRYWLFAVEDNGQGIAPEHHERIFRVFKRLHGQDIPGTGIGLAICERIVTHYGGRIWVESEESKGSAFLFTIPAVQLPRPGEIPASSSVELPSA